MRKVQPGDPMRIPAGTFNAMIDAARAEAMRSTGERPGGSPLGRSSYSAADVLNETGEDIPLGAVVFYHTWHPEDGAEGGYYEAAKPHDADVGVLEHPFQGIALEPIPDDTIGQIATTGGPVLALYDPGVDPMLPGVMCGFTDDEWYLAPVGYKKRYMTWANGTDGMVPVVFMPPYLYRWAGHAAQASDEMVADDTEYTARGVGNGVTWTVYRLPGCYVADDASGIILRSYWVETLYFAPISDRVDESRVVGTFQVITDIRVYSGNLQVKTREIKAIDVEAESGWTYVGPMDP